jgi:outer membrane receptor protein involved in Fe transport
MSICLLAFAHWPFPPIQEPESQSQVSETVILAPAEELEAPRAVAVTVTGEELAATGERSLPRALGEVAGVWIQETNLGGGAVVLNGLLGNRVLIVVDGVRLNDSTTRSGPNQSLNGIDPRTVERIEVVHGPGALLYGSDAVGGAILIWTKRRLPGDGDRAWRGGVDLDYGTAVEGGRATLSSSYAEGSHGVLGIGSIQQFDDLRAGHGEIQDPTGYGGTAWFGSYDLDLGEQRGLHVIARRTRDLDVPRTDRLMPGFGQTQPSNAVWDFELQDRWSWIAAYSDDDVGPIADRMEARLSLRQYTEERRIRSLGSTTETFERDKTDTVGLAVDWQRALGEQQLLTWGLGADADEVDSDATDTDITTGIGTAQDGAFAEDAGYLASGAFVRDEIFAFEPWILTAGVRYSYFDFAFDNFPANGGGREQGHFDAWIGSLSAQRPLATGLTGTATLGQAFRAPNLEDLANNSNFAGGTEFANPDLDPERSLTAQLSFDLVDTEHGRWSSYFGLHATWIDDLISRTLLSLGAPPPGDETYLRNNVGTGTVFGANLGGEHELGTSGTPWSLQGQLSWTYGIQEGDNVDPNDPTEDEVPFQRIPPLFGEVGLRWEQPGPGRSLDWGQFSVSWAADQERLNPLDELDPRIGADGTDGWVVLDAEWGGPLSQDGASRWHAGVLNLLDSNYRVHASGIDAPGFQIVFGVSLVF